MLNFTALMIDELFYAIMNYYQVFQFTLPKFRFNFESVRQ